MERRLVEELVCTFLSLLEPEALRIVAENGVDWLFRRLCPGWPSVEAVEPSCAMKVPELAVARESASVLCFPYFTVYRGKKISSVLEER